MLRCSLCISLLTYSRIRKYSDYILIINNKKIVLVYKIIIYFHE